MHLNRNIKIIKSIACEKLKREADIVKIIFKKVVFYQVGSAD